MAKKKAVKKQIEKKRAVKQAKNRQVGEAKPKAGRPRSDGPSMAALKREVKEKHPQIKGLVDATREELTAVLKDPKGLPELQAVWKQRSRERHEAWLRSGSASAKTVLAKRKNTCAARDGEKTS